MVLGSDIDIDQCLFGYEDGHRLLASSIGLPPSASAQLLLASDLAPGMLGSASVDYWTGIPLPDASVYALLRTWSAPEIERPGCVWTHAVLLPFSDFPRFADLSHLQSLFVRPSADQRYSEYAAKLKVGLSADETVTDRGRRILSAGLSVIQAVYSLNRSSRVPSVECVEDAIFAVWSQQWPKLRRQFSFRTSGVADSGSMFRFDLQVDRRWSPEAVADLAPTSWPIVAAEDLLQRSASPLRRFLWRYGSDVEDVYSGFQRLVEVFIRAGSKELLDFGYEETVQFVLNGFAGVLDARLLKQDLLSPTRDQYSRLPAPDPIGAMRLQLKGVGTNDLIGLERTQWDVLIRELLTQRKQQLFEFIIDALSADSTYAHRVVAEFGPVVDVQDFWLIVHHYPPLIAVVISSHPEYLDCDDLLDAPEAVRHELLSHPAISRELAVRLIKRLLPVDDAAVVFAMWARWPDEVAGAVIRSLAVSRPATAWARVLVRHYADWAKSGLLVVAAEAGVLPRIATLLDPSSDEVVSVGVGPWLIAISELPPVTDLRVLTFLLNVALRTKGAGVDLSIATALEPVYNGILAQRLPVRLFDSLVRTFPWVPFWKEWDNCYRLLLAVGQRVNREEVNMDVVLGGIVDQKLRQRLQKIVRKGDRGDVDEDDL